MPNTDLSLCSWVDLWAELRSVDSDIYAITLRANQLLREDRQGPYRDEVLTRLFHNPDPQGSRGSYRS